VVNPADLVAELPPGVAVTDPERSEKYRRDRFTASAAGMPAVVVRAESAEHVRHTMAWAHRHGVPVVPRGAGSGLSGGATAVDGGIVLSLERMTRIDIDPSNRVATVEPGALNVAVKEAAGEHGLWYPPDPGSYRISTIGGNVATNAGGLCCLKYGVTADYVLGLDVVLADGRELRLGGNTLKDVAGLNLVQLFIGSEGTLGVVTRVVLRLVPARGALSTLVATFPDLSSVGRAVVDLGRVMQPAMLEIMDRSAVNAVEDLRPRGLDRDAGALLILQSDAPGGQRSADMETATRVCEAAGAKEVFSTDDEFEGQLFVEARRDSGPAAEARGALLPEDICVPVDRLPEVLAAIEGIGRRTGVEIVVVGHAGDGNLHPGVIYPPGNEEARARAWSACDEILDLAVTYGGTITGEHGVGRAKRHALPGQIGADVLDVSRDIKHALDPTGILNPGAVL
jgi:glycolate oxidase